MKILKKVIFLILIMPALGYSQKKTSQTALKPKLVVGIVVDQMRWDYLYRFTERYGEGGFKRLLKDGFTCENTNISYIPTVTAAGHAGIYTGSIPALTGIVGNEWITQNSGKEMYCTEDTTVKTVGSTSVAGLMSPKNLLVTTIADELKLATNFKSKVIGIALKDRGGILPAGHTANAAYWFDDATGSWITSTFYMQNLPEWATSFNNKKLTEKYIKGNWNTLYPIDTYKKGTSDDSKYEGKLPGEKAPIFPHMTANMMGRNFSAIRNSPYGNTLTFDFAKQALISENLGKGEVTDMLAISLSSTDYIGHQFAINSIEIEDTYLRLDQDLASFLTALDKQVGEGNYTVFLSADHGAAHNPSYLNDQKIAAGFWPSRDIMKDLNLQLEKEFKTANLVLSLANYQVNFNNQAIESKNIDHELIKAFTINYLKKLKAVVYAIDLEKINDASLPEPLKTRMINGYSHLRSGAIQVILEPGWYSGYSTTGTTHGTWNPYDAHIPLVFMGWGVKKGVLHRNTEMADIAPTLSALLKIQEPNGNVGKVISEVLK